MKMKFDDSGLKKALEKAAKSGPEIAKEHLKKQTFEIECKTCKKTISVPVGKSKCPHCKTEITFTLK